MWNRDWSAPPNRKARAAPCRNDAMQKIVPQTGGVRGDEGSLPPASLDRPLHAALARLTAGVSPAALGLAWADWVQHLLVSPDKQLELAGKAVQRWASLSAF